MKKAFFIYFISLSVCASAQKYDFVNYTIEDGLVQSQVNAIVEDRYGLLWISTSGGVSRFDGKNFTNFNYGNGLLHSITDLVYTDHHNTIWIVHETSVQRYDGRTFRTYTLDGNAKRITDFKETPDGQLYALSAGKIYLLDDAHRVFLPVTDSTQKVTAIATDSSGLYAAFQKKGIFHLKENQWTSRFQWTGPDTAIYIWQLIPKRNKTGWWALSMDVLLSIEGDTRTKINTPTGRSMWCMQEDLKGNIFIGTIQGVYFIKPGLSPEHIAFSKGLTDNAVRDIHLDHEGNVWFATDGSGIFKFHDETFRTIDQSIGLPGDLVMALAMDSSNVFWAGTLEKGLSRIKEGKIMYLPIPTVHPESNKINVLLNDRHQKLWIGTIGGGLWTYHQNTFNQIGKQIKGFPKSFTTIYQSNDDVVWTTSPKTVARIDGDQIDLIQGFSGFCYTAFELNADTMLIGTSDGLAMINRSLQIKYIQLEGTKGFLIGNIVSWGKYIVFGTSENGILLWDRYSGSSRTYRCNESNGLSSNMCFSILPDADALYVGTINGINKIKFDPANLKFTVTALNSSNQRLGPECNQNAMVKDNAGRIWVGTTKGIYIYQPSDQSKPQAPKLFLRSIEIYGQSTDSASGQDTLSAWNRIPKKINLAPDQNHLTFTVDGVHLSAPEDLLYQYFLVGADTAYTRPKAINSVIYPNLPPGHYVFKAKATIKNQSDLYSEILNYPFVIRPRMYQKTWFRIVVVLVLILMGALIQKYRMYLRSRQSRLIEEARKQEQVKIQQRTSEDLHDDLGNKITRLSLLTDILQTKLKGDTDQQKLMTQIRENIQGLYMGTKDIIWALAPNQNSLYDALLRIQNFGAELFQDSPVTFTTSGINESLKSLKPPFEFNRNLIMICKESLHNILKHADASATSIHISMSAAFGLHIVITDNGKGFIVDPSAKRGNGLDNMQKRIQRIGGTLQIQQEQPSGTSIHIDVKIPPSEG